jgi:hypothetical protein
LEQLQAEARAGGFELKDSTGGVGTTGFFPFRVPNLGFAVGGAANRPPTATTVEAVAKSR